jgi:hypothetical protein
MPKAVKLSPSLVEARPAPAAATSARSAQSSVVRLEPTLPLQLRLPRDEIRRIKVAAAEREQTISQFMLACVHATMQSGKAA